MYGKKSSGKGKSMLKGKQKNCTCCIEKKDCSFKDEKEKENCLNIW